MFTFMKLDPQLGQGCAALRYESIVNIPQNPDVTVQWQYVNRKLTFWTSLAGTCLPCLTSWNTSGKFYESKLQRSSLINDTLKLKEKYLKIRLLRHRKHAVSPLQKLSG